jgi:flagellar biosynthesis component FlhA
MEALDPPPKRSGKRPRDLIKQDTMKEKAFILVLCVLGVLGVCYGMANKNHPVFIAGLVLVVAGYVMIRRKLKAYVRDKYPSEQNQKRTGGT